MEQKIVRHFSTELRAAGDGEMTVEGYALKFDKETIIGPPSWGWREKISRRALDGAKTDDVVLNLNHSMDNLLARTTNGSLALTRDDIGLKIRAAIIDTALGRDVFKMVQDGLITRMSFAATIKKSVWTFSEDGSEMDLREITEIDRLFDVSAVAFPAYEDTPLAARDKDALRHFAEREYREQIKRLNKILEA